MFFTPNSTKLQVALDGYKESKSFHINTFGVSGTLKIKKLKEKKKKNEEGKEEPYNLVDPSLDPLQTYIEIGTYIGMCPHPYSRTKVIKFLPRYIIINKLDLPIVIKERKSNHQIALA